MIRLNRMKALSLFRPTARPANKPRLRLRLKKTLRLNRAIRSRRSPARLSIIQPAIRTPPVAGTRRWKCRRRTRRKRRPFCRQTSNPPRRLYRPTSRPPRQACPPANNPPRRLFRPASRPPAPRRLPAPAVSNQPSRRPARRRAAATCPGRSNRWTRMPRACHPLPTVHGGRPPHRRRPCIPTRRLPVLNGPHRPPGSARAEFHPARRRLPALQSRLPENGRWAVFCRD